MTEETRQLTKKESDRFRGSVRISCGKFYTDDEFHYFGNETIDTVPVHGTGCLLSSAIVCGLASGYTNIESCQAAVDFVQDSIKNAKKIGSDQLIAMI